MAKIIGAKKTWSRTKPTEMAAFGLNSVRMMTGNSSYLTPKIPLSDMTDSCDLVNELYPNRNDGDENKTDDKEAVDDLETKLQKQQAYVTEQAGGVTLVIESAGFVATTNGRKTVVRLGDTPTPKLKPMGGNRMKSRVKKVAGATSYVFIFFDDPDSIISADIDTITCISADGGSFSFCYGGGFNEMGGFTANKKIYCIAICKNKVGYGNLSAITSSGVLGN